MSISIDSTKDRCRPPDGRTTVSETTPVEPSGSSTSRISLRGGAISLWASQISRRGCRLLFLLLAARFLGPSLFGLYTLLFTVTEMTAVITGAGYGDYLTRELSKSSEQAYLVFIQVTKLRWLYTVVLGSLLALLAYVSAYSAGPIHLGLLMFVTLFPRAVLESCQGALKAAERFAAVAATDAIQGLTLIIAGVCVFRQRMGVAGAVTAEIVAVCVAVAVALAITLRVFARSQQRNAANGSWQDLIRRTLPFNLYPLITQIYDRFDVILLAKLANETAVGLYGLPYRIYASLQILPYGILGTLFPFLSREGWTPEVRHLTKTVLELLYQVALLLVLITQVLAAPLTGALLGPGYKGSEVALTILIWATVPMFLNYGFNTLLLAHRRERVFFVTASVCVIFNIAANLWLIPRYSFRAAALVTVLTELVLLIQNLYWIRLKFRSFVFPTRFLQTTAWFCCAFAIALAGPRYIPAALAALAAMGVFLGYLLKAKALNLLF